MLWFSEKRKNFLCGSLNEAWNLADEIGEMGATQTADGLEDLESVKVKKYGKASLAIGELGAKYSGMGVGFTEHASLLKTELEAIANEYGCKLKIRK